MDGIMAFRMPRRRDAATLAAINEHLAAVGLSIAREDALMLAERRAELLAETRWIRQFDVESCVAVLERACPDFCGLHVNLYDLLLPHEEELARVGSKMS